MGSLAHWTGREARVLRRALRLSVRAFAERLGVGVRTITKWESLGSRTTPRPFTQSILDTALSTADVEAKQRFELLLRQDGEVPVRDYYRSGPKEWDYETWTDDLGRASACLARQDFTFASSLVDRWLRRFSPLELDGTGLALHARSLVLLGDLQRDQGLVRGVQSASHTYRCAHQFFRDLDVPRRAAQVELSLAVVEEMNGRLNLAARRYELLADDSRLSPRDRARALLWVGTALSKKGSNAHAVTVMAKAIRQFEQLEEPDDWSVAHQKMALAHRGAGELGMALRYMDVALANRSDSPMQRVRLQTAHAHVLLSERGTSDGGLRLLDEAAETSRRFGMSHQLASIDAIRSAFERVN